MTDHNHTPLLRIEDLAVNFHTQQGGSGGVVQAVTDVSLTIYPRQTLAVVGESGSGKSVTAMSVLKLLPSPPARYERGRILWRAGPAPEVDLLQQGEKQMQKVRGAQIAMIFQEPMTSLNPVYTIGEQIVEAVLLHQKVGHAEAIDIAERALADVGIAAPRERLKEYPHQMSGGMRQRIMIAMALACRPRLLLADEPTTALDVTIQAQILELLRKLQDEHDMSVMLITHDLGVVAENADVVAVMFAGRVVEYGSVYDVFGRPLHPYTRGLLGSMPRLGQRSKRLTTVAEGAEAPSDFPADYKVRPHRTDGEGLRAYRDMAQRLHEVESRHWILCEAVGQKDTSEPTRPDLASWRDAAVTAA
jgi:oligopeptide transport system ATP-binding protein